MNKRVAIGAIAAVAVLMAVAPVMAVVIPHRLFNHNAVLQQGMEVPVWGMAREGEQVTVAFQGQRVSTTTVKNIWMVRLQSLKAGGPFDMVITGEDNAITLHDIMVGEVWIASGQSNMQMSVGQSDQAATEIGNSGDAGLRLFQLRMKTAAVPRRSFVDEPISYEDKMKPNAPVFKFLEAWLPSGPGSVDNFSAVGYFFGRELRKNLKVPVGIIQTAWGGTRSEAWTSRYALEQLAKADPKHFQSLLDNPGDGPNKISVLYNAMVAPLIPYAFRGVIWYQGESNSGASWAYRTVFPVMIEDWRQAWNQGDFPFLFVQIAPWQAAPIDKINKEPMESGWAELQEAQLLTAKTVPNTAMAVITDYGDPLDIHPKWKQPVGFRLALAARAIAYGEPVVYYGPVYKSMKVEGDKAVLSFDWVDGGLVAKGGELTGFTIAGEDRKFVNAQAKIVGDTVVVWSPDVKKPAAVRFGWANYAVVNLFNKADLPASPFRTDDFPMKTAPKE